VVGSTDHHTVYTLTLAHQIAEVAVGRAARVSAGALVLAVVGLDDLPRRVASGRRARELAAPARIFQQGPDLVAKLVRVPFRVVAALTIDIGDRNHLHVRLLQEVQHDPRPLRPHPYASEGQLVARRNIARSAEYVSRDDRECGRSHAVSNKRAARDPSLPGIGFDLVFHICHRIPPRPSTARAPRLERHQRYYSNSKMKSPD